MQTHAAWMRWGFFAAGLLLVTPGLGGAQPFSSGSTGADGPFSPTANTTRALPPNGVFNFTTINIPANVTVTFTRNAANTPVTLLATGDVTIAGTLDLDGQSGGHALVGTGTAPNGGLGGGGGKRRREWEYRDSHLSRGRWPRPRRRGPRESHRGRAKPSLLGRGRRAQRGRRRRYRGHESGVLHRRGGRLRRRAPPARPWRIGRGRRECSLWGHRGWGRGGRGCPPVGLLHPDYPHRDHPGQRGWGRERG